MINNSDIKAAISKVCGPQKQRYNRQEVIDTVRRVLVDAGLMVPHDGHPMTRQGVVALFSRNVVLLSPAAEGYHIVPLTEGTQGLEILLDGVWRPVKVVPAPAGSATKTRLDVPDDVAVFGLYARLPYLLSAAPKTVIESNSQPSKMIK